MSVEIDLKFAYALIGRAERDEPHQRYMGVEAIVEERFRGIDRQVVITLLEPLEELKDFNQVWALVGDKMYEGQGRYDPVNCQIIVTLYRDQGAQAKSLGLDIDDY